MANKSYEEKLSEKNAEDLDSEVIGESSEYSPKSEFKKPIIVQEAIQKINIARSKEMRAGYVNTSKSSDGTILQTTIPDAREEYVNAVKSLAIITAPEIRKDKEANDKLIEIKKKEKEIWDKYAYEEFYIKKTAKGNLVVKTGIKFMPPMDAELLTTALDGIKQIATKGYWNNKVSFYWANMIELYDELFEEISCMLDRLNYFKPTQEW